MHMSERGTSEANRVGRKERSGTSEIGLTRCDERALSYLADVDADYHALIAGSAGINDELLERRMAVLADAGLVEPVDSGGKYRITAAGREMVER